MADRMARGVVQIWLAMWDTLRQLPKSYTHLEVAVEAFGANQILQDYRGGEKQTKKENINII